MSFQSVHDMLTPPGQIRKQKFWDFCDGDAIRSWWSTTTTGSGVAAAMDDIVDGGIILDTGTTINSQSNMWMNGIDHYSDSGSVMICVMTFSDTTTINGFGGFGQTIGATHLAISRTNSSVTNFHLLTNNTSTATTVESSIARDTAEHKSRIELRASSALLSLDAVLEALSTTNLPSSNVEPHFTALNQGGAVVRTNNIRYCECFNT